MGPFCDLLELRYTSSTSELAHLGFTMLGLPVTDASSASLEASGSAKHGRWLSRQAMQIGKRQPTSPPSDNLLVHDRQLSLVRIGDPWSVRAPVTDATDGIPLFRCTVSCNMLVLAPAPIVRQFTLQRLSDTMLCADDGRYASNTLRLQRSHWYNRLLILV